MMNKILVFVTILSIILVPTLSMSEQRKDGVYLWGEFEFFDGTKKNRTITSGFPFLLCNLKRKQATLEAERRGWFNSLRIHCSEYKDGKVFRKKRYRRIIWAQIIKMD